MEDEEDGEELEDGEGHVEVKGKRQGSLHDSSDHDDEEVEVIDSDDDEEYEQPIKKVRT